MPIINIDLGYLNYDIHIDNGLYEKTSTILSSFDRGQKWIILTQKNIFDIHGKMLELQLIESGFSVKTIFIHDGETAKNLEGIQNIYSKMIVMGCDRSTTLIALGGGVVGDVTGFVAATFMRGIDYIQLPTTLLAMVDSAIGGKTGVNLPAGKNLVGAIWQPKAVICDPQLLNSLPPREVSAALGEVIKYGAILDKEFFKLVESNLSKLLDMRNSNALVEIIVKCVELKARVVEADESEGNLRRILNFGHTFGHALEKYFGYGVLRHGEAVAFGMIAAGKLSVKKSNFKKQDFNILRNMIQKLPLPKLPPFSSQEIFNILKTDKKVRDGKLNFVLLLDIGKTEIRNDVEESLVVKVIESLKEL